MALVNIVEKKRVCSYKYKSITKIKTEIVKILKNWNVFKFRFRNLSKSKKIQNTGNIEKLNFIISNNNIVFIKYR